MGSEAALYPMATRASTDWGAMGLCEPLPSSRQTQFSSIYIKMNMERIVLESHLLTNQSNNNTRRGY